VATVVEMIHMATLVHDDVLDESDLRRGGETVNKRRGNEAAVILGDYLISKSFHLCSQLDDQRTALRVGEITSIVCEGEMLQNHHRGDFTVTREQHFDIIERKTGALIALACELGALQAGASNDVASLFFEFGELLGAAFQIQDDVLDLTGSEQVVGKNLGRDLQKGTLTLPVIHHLASLSDQERAATIEQIRGGAALNGHRASFVSRLEQTGSVQHARDTAHELVDKAKALLLTQPDSPAREMLLAMAEAVVSRAY
jgi:octaprenyl-diphosphate synthase